MGHARKALLYDAQSNHTGKYSEVGVKLDFSERYKNCAIQSPHLCRNLCIPFKLYKSEKNTLCQYSCTPCTVMGHLVQVF